MRNRAPLAIALSLLAGAAQAQLPSPSYGHIDVQSMTVNGGPVSSLQVLPRGATTARTLAQKMGDALSLPDFGAKCDGVTDDSAAINAAMVSGRRIGIPAGMVCNGASISQGGITGLFVGPGQIRTSDGNLRGPVVSQVTNAPAATAPTNVVQGFNGDLTHIPTVVEHRVTNNALPLPASSGAGSSVYLFVNELAATLYSDYFSSGGNAASGTVPNAVRTGYATHVDDLTHTGQGDAATTFANVYIQGPNVGALPISGETNFLQGPSGSALNANVTAGAPGVYLQGIGDIDLNDNGYDVAAIGSVINLFRANGTGTLGNTWIGQRVQSKGSQPGDAAFSATGGYRMVLDAVDAQGGGTSTVVAAGAGQRYYGNATQTNINQFPSTVNLGTEYFDYSQQNGWEFIVGGTSVLHINSAGAYANGNLLLTADAGGAINAQISGPTMGWARAQSARAGEQFDILDFIKPGAALGSTVGSAYGVTSLAGLIAMTTPNGAQPYSVLADPLASYTWQGVLSAPTAAGNATLQLVSPNNTGGIPSWTANMIQSDNPGTRWMRLTPGMLVSNLAGSPIACIAANATVSAVPQVSVRQFELFPQIGSTPAATDWAPSTAYAVGAQVENAFGLWSANNAGTSAAADIVYATGTPGVAGPAPVLATPVSVGGPRYGSATDSNGLDPGPWNPAFLGITFVDGSVTWTLRQRAEYEPLRLGNVTLSSPTTAACPGAAATVSINNGQMTINSIVAGGTLAVGEWVYGGGAPIADSVLGNSPVAITGLVSGTANMPGAVYSISGSASNASNVSVIAGTPVTFTLDNASVQALTVETVAASTAAMWAARQRTGGTVRLSANYLTWNHPIINPGHTLDKNNFRAVNFVGDGTGSTHIALPVDAGLNGLAGAIMEADNLNESVYSGAKYSGFTVQFTGQYPEVFGAATVREYAITAGEASSFEDLNFIGFFGLGLIDDHQKLLRVVSSGTYGVVAMPYSHSTGNFGVESGGMGSNSIAGFMVYPTAALDSNLIKDTDNGYQPIGWYAGPANTPNVQSSGGGGLSNLAIIPSYTESIGGPAFMFAPRASIGHVLLLGGGQPGIGSTGTQISNGQGGLWPTYHLIQALNIDTLISEGAQWGPEFPNIQPDPAIGNVPNGGTYAGIATMVWAAGSCTNIQINGDPTAVAANAASGSPGPTPTSIPLGCTQQHLDNSFTNGFGRGAFGQATGYWGPVNPGSILQEAGQYVGAYTDGGAVVGVSLVAQPAYYALTPYWTDVDQILATLFTANTPCAQGNFMYPTGVQGGVSGAVLAGLDPTDAVGTAAGGNGANGCYMSFHLNSGRGPKGVGVLTTSGTGQANAVPVSGARMVKASGPGDVILVTNVPLGETEIVCNANASGGVTQTLWPPVGGTIGAGAVNAGAAMAPGVCLTEHRMGAVEFR